MAQNPAGSAAPVTSEPVQAAAGAARPKKKRGRETAADMVRSLGVVMILVVLMWFLARPPASDEQLRTVDPASDIAALRDAVPSALVPRGLPDQWRPTVTSDTSDPTQLRIGYNTPSSQYAEYAAVVTPDAKRLTDLIGSDRPLGEVTIDGALWQRYRDGDGSVSFVRTVTGLTLIIGTTRETAGEPELRTLIGALSGS